MAYPSSRGLAAGALTLVATTSLVLAPALTPSAAAAPAVTTTGTSPGVGAARVDTTISSPPNSPYPPAPKSASGCSYADVTAPSGVRVKHVAPCQTGPGDGTAASPWRTIAAAMANLNPGEVAYVHDGPDLVDYRESSLRPARSGTGSTARITLMAAPGERPWIGKSPTATTAQPILHLTRAWWVVDGLSFDAAGQLLQSPVVRVGSGATTTAAHHIVLRRLSSRNAATPKSVVEFDGARNSALLDSIGAGVNGPLGLLEPRDANGRPVHVPVAGSGDYTDHHAITVINGSDRILIRNNESAGHNGDSLQCGEESTSSAPVTSNLTVEGNRFHQDEENAIDLKACQGVTIRGNKVFGYRPSRPYNTDGTLGTRAPHGDALVAHAAASGRPAARVLIELNRFWDNSRSVNLGSSVGTAVVRRNLVFNASTASCGIGAGMALRGRTTEVYHNTLDNLLPLAVVGCGNPWSTSEKYAVRLNPSASGSTAVLWNNVVANATSPYTQSGTIIVDASRNLFEQSFSGMPPGSVVGDPDWVVEPSSNDYYTRQGSPARDAATRVPAAVADPRANYCDDPSPSEPDTLVEPDIGFLESCS